MVLRVKCRCGAALKISAGQAGMKLACAACKQPFRIPLEKFQKAEAFAKEKLAAQLRELGHPASPPPSRAPQRSISTQQTRAQQSPKIHDDPAPSELDLLADAAMSEVDLLRDLAADAHSAHAEAAPVALVVPPEAPVPVGYAHDGRSNPLPGRKFADVIQGPKRSFWADASLSFIYPFRSVNNAVTFAVLLGMIGVQYFAIAAPFIGALCSLIIFGWLAAMYLSVICDTATGSEDLPGIRMQDGFIEDIIKPAFKYIGAQAVVLAPGAILTGMLIAGTLPPSWLPLVPIWLGIGIFLLPMSLMFFSFDALAMIFRIDLIAVTIFRTFLPYLAMWLMLLVVGFFWIAATFGAYFAKTKAGGIFPDFTGTGLVVNLGVEMFNLYLNIVSMRLIGLYYLHFKKRFAIIVE